MIAKYDFSKKIPVSSLSLSKHPLNQFTKSAETIISLRSSAGPIFETYETAGGCKVAPPPPVSPERIGIFRCGFHRLVGEPEHIFS